MNTQNYTVFQQNIETLLHWVKLGEIAIPEIQRPFVWDSSKVRNMMDSLYHGYPIGYVITWRNPDIRLKDGTRSDGKKILIDGQQRITAMRAAILGEDVINKDYEKVRIKISFHPIEEKFEVQNNIILKDKNWVADIAQVFDPQTQQYAQITDYVQKNPDADQQKVIASFSKLYDLLKKPVGLIELAAELSIETVTEIFIRINAQGVKLSQADFAMSKIAANETYGGNNLRKAIDYFCHLCIEPDFYKQISKNDPEFSQTELFRKISWLKNEVDDLYDPQYEDVLRVAFTSEFKRGKLADLVSLLSGRNFESRTFEDVIVEDSFKRLQTGVERYVNETNFKRFLLIIKSAGFVIPEMIRSTSALNMAYIIYLSLKEQKENDVMIEKYVKRWFVYSTLTSRYSGSAESIFDFDIRQISEKPFGTFLQEKETADLSEAFWTSGLPQYLNSTSTGSPFFHVFLAAQIKNNNQGFLSKDMFVSHLLTIKGDIHHLFPKAYLKKHNLSRGKYNQIANYVYMQSETNIRLGQKSPKEYMKLVIDQIESGKSKLSGINRINELYENMKMNCIPLNFIHAGIADYESFLEERRLLMSQKIKEYYFSL